MRRYKMVVCDDKAYYTDAMNDLQAKRQLVNVIDWPEGSRWWSITSVEIPESEAV